MRLKTICKSTILGLLSDKMYLKYVFYRTFGKKLNLNNPVSFNEKLQWLKLYDHNPIYPKWVDKCEAKKMAEAILGRDYIIPTIAVWNSVDEIDWSVLPPQFVIKTTNGGGSNGVIVCPDKAKLDIAKASEQLRGAYNFNIYKQYREWPYSQFKPRIIAEKLMSDDSPENEGALSDYKFYCFNGYVACCMVCTNRGKGETHFYFFDKNWNLLRINKRGLKAPEGFTLPKPYCIDEMFEMASLLSKGFPFVRTDLYVVNGHVYFGELTFYPDSGLDRNYLPETDIWLGSLINQKNIL